MNKQVQSCKDLALRCGRLGLKIEPRRENYSLERPTDDLKEIDRFWTDFPSAKIGISLEMNNICALDIHPSKGGWESLKRLKKDFGSLPTTPSFLKGDISAGMFKSHPEQFIPEGYREGLNFSIHGYIALSHEDECILDFFPLQSLPGFLIK